MQCPTKTDDSSATSLIPNPALPPSVIIPKGTPRLLRPKQAAHLLSANPRTFEHKFQSHPLKSIRLQPNSRHKHYLLESILSLAYHLGFPPSVIQAQLNTLPPARAPSFPSGKSEEMSKGRHRDNLQSEDPIGTTSGPMLLTNSNTQ